ncbi:PQQ-binding-like beta-propeller repeat protein [Micromonospora sp. NPDC049171]|uniref:outer membrane protein assembly factor BamB family protein n=1 Tax=Micromonospora sp. NPDC049171 TaxID=3155770 RepID=UPI0033CF4A1C
MRRRGRSAVALAVLALMGTTLTAAPAPAAAPGADSRPAIMLNGNWPGWQKDVLGTRFNPAEKKITQSTVGNLKLKWAFVFPDIDGANGSQPAVVDGVLYVGSRDSKFYALDAVTGATKWVFDRTPIAGPSDVNNPNPSRSGPAVSGNLVVFGDNRGYLYALNKETGALVWQRRLSDHPATVVTSSSLIFNGKVYVGVSSSEEQYAANDQYPCCTFRGQLVSLDLNTGAVVWRHYTMPPAVQVGTTPDGVARYESSGAAVWGSPVIEPISRTVYFATGNNYTGAGGDGDTVVAVNADTGALRWKQQMTESDSWTVGCLLPTPKPNCEGLEDGTNLDYDFGATPNIFYANNRLLVGIGQKSGIYHTFDARTGQVVWQQQLSIPQPNGGKSGIQWGSSYDGRRLYVATWEANPGTLFALNPATGAIQWTTPNPSNGCSTGGAVAFPDNCHLAHISAVTTTPGLVYEGSTDGKFRVYNSNTGAVLWSYDTVRTFTGVNGETGSGGSVSGNGGAVVANGMVYVQSGYYNFYGIPGRVLLAFGL